MYRYIVFLFFSFLKNIFIDYAITVVPFPFPFIPLHPAHYSHLHSLPFSSCPWVIHISSLASISYTILFPILFPIHFLYYPYPPPVYFPPTTYAIYSLYFSPLSPPPTPLLITLHVISISVVLFLF